MSTTATIFECFKILVTAQSSKESPSSSQKVGKGQQFNDSLIKTFTTLKIFLETTATDGALPEEVRHRLKVIISDPACPTDVQWHHTRCLLILLTALHAHLLKEIKLFKKSESSTKERKPGDAPPLPPDALSIGHQRVLATVLQFVVSIGICTHLSTGVGIPLNLRSGFSNILSKSSSLPKWTVCSRLYEVVRTLLTCVTVPSLGGFILTRHLGDLMASLLQLLHEPRLEEAEISSVNASSGANASSGVNASSVNTDSVNASSVNASSGVNASSVNASGVNADSVNASNVNAENYIEKDATSSEKDGFGTTSNTPPEQTRRIIFCQQNLRRLLEQAYQPAVIRELLVLQGGPGGSKKEEKGNVQSKNPLPRSPSWLRTVCADLLMERIIQKQGVQYLLRSVLDISDSSMTKSSSLSWQKCDAVANILTEYHPSSISEEEYFKAICPQIMQLLHFDDRLILQQVLRVCCTSIGALVVKNAQLAEKYLIVPLQEPFLNTLQTSEMPNNVQHEVVTIATEDCLTKCLENLCKVYLEGSAPSSALLETLYPIMLPLYQLYSCTRESLWVFRPVVEKLLLLGLQSCDHSTSVELVVFITEIKGHKKYSSMHDDVDFILASTGGVDVVYNAYKSSDERFTDSVFQGEKSAACCSELLLAGKGKMDRLAADFFLLVLKELSFLLDDEPQLSTDESRPEEMLLAVESRQLEGISRLQRSLRVLSLVSSLCEGLGPTVLQSLEHMIMFAHATLDRACKHLDREENTLLGGFEAETVMFAFGLLSAVIGGSTEKKVTTKNRDSLKALLPLLEKVSSQHPSETLQQMAANLGIAIATHGAVWTENTTEKFGKKGKKITKSKKSVKIEELISGIEIKQDEDDKTVESAGRLEDFAEPYLDEKEERDVQGNTSQARSITANHMEKKVSTDRHLQEVDRAQMKSVGEINIRLGQAKEHPVDSEEFDKAYEELFDPLIPVRGHALIALSRLIREKNPKAIHEQDKLLKLFLEHLSNDDSYVYLTAVGALVSLADRFTADVIPALCAEYAHGESKERRSKVKRSVETRLKLGEALVKATRMMGEMAPLYAKRLLNVFLSGAKDEDEHIRASSLSNLGEICQLLRFSIAGSVHEIFLCLTSVLQADSNITVRRACVLVLCLILRGLGTDALKVLETEMRDLYRLLKLLHTKEKDEVMLIHVELALEELNLIVRKYLFPKQTLSKKIIVLP